MLGWWACCMRLGRPQYVDSDLEAVLTSGQLATVWAAVRQRRGRLLLARLADQVIAGGREDSPARVEDEDDDLAETVEWWQVGFGSGWDGGKSRREQFLPAVQAALGGRMMTPPEPLRLKLSRRR